MNVGAYGSIPGVRTPNLPLAKQLFTGLRIQFPSPCEFSPQRALTRRETESLSKWMRYRRGKRGK